MNPSTSKSRVIPIKPMAAAASLNADELHRELARDGWLRQTTLAEPSLSEMARMYARLGYEVRIEDYVPLEDERDADGEAGRARLGTLFVRKPS